MSSRGDRRMSRRRVSDPRIARPDGTGEPLNPVIQFPAASRRRRRGGRSRDRRVPPDLMPPTARPASRRPRPIEPPARLRSTANPSAPVRGTASSSSSQPLPFPPEGQPPATRPARRARSPRRRARPPKLLVYFTRFVVLGVGVAGLAGTTLSVWNPALRSHGETPVPIRQNAVTQPLPKGEGPASPEERLALGKELSSLKSRLGTLAAQMPGLTLAAFLYDTETGNFMNLQGAGPISAASTIKVPVLVAFLQDVDAGLIKLDEPLTMQPSQIATGSGDLQDQPPGTVYTALETASWMIINSDNTATNMLIDRLGGAEKLNQRFQDWGLKHTILRNPLPDLEGTNTTSPEDLVRLMAFVNQGELLSLRSRDRMLAIMQRTYTKSLLPQGLGEGAIISHKTGDIGSVVGDVGLVDLPNGKRYIIAAMVQRPFNDGRAQELIRLVSRSIYDELGAMPEPQPTQAGSAATANPQPEANSELDPEGLPDPG